MERSAPRILIVNRPAEGGAFEHVATLSNALCERGYEVILAGPMGERAASLSAPVIPVNITRVLSPGADARSIHELAKLFHQLAPDLIHAHGSKGGVMARAARLARLRTPLVHTPHGYAFAGHIPGQSHPTAYRVIERLLEPLASRILCVCEAEARLARTLAPARKIRVVHNGIEPPVLPLEPLQVDIDPGRRVIGVVSGLRAGKGLETLVEALPRIAAADHRVLVLIGGEGPEREPLERLASRLGVEKSLLLVGNVSDPYGLLARAELFVNPSWAESFPYTILEAMGASKAIVATDVGGVGEAIEDGASGTLVPPRDPVTLADAIISLLGDPETVSRLAQAARNRLVERFSVSRMIDGIVGVYDELGVESP